MFRLSNLVTALFGVIAALGTILGISSLSSANRTAITPDSNSGPAEQLPSTTGTAVTPLSIQESIAQAARQVGQNATTSQTAGTTAQNPSAEFVVQGEGAVMTTEPAPPSTPSEATATALDPSPGVPTTPSAPATVPSQPPVAQTVPAPATQPAPVKAMW